MKKIFSILLISGLAATTVAHAQDARARQILNKLSATIKKANSVSAKFTIHMDGSHSKAKVSQSGTFQMKGEQYNVTLTGGQQIICDGKSVWTYLPKNKEVQISAYNPSEQTISPAKLFSGSYEKDYNYSYAGSKTFAGHKVEAVTLRPKKKGQAFSKVELYVNPSSNMIAGGNVYTTDGNTYTYSISNVNTHVSISNSAFKFNTKAHPGVDVIDLR